MMKYAYFGAFALLVAGLGCGDDSASLPTGGSGGSGGTGGTGADGAGAAGANGGSPNTGGGGNGGAPNTGGGGADGGGGAAEGGGGAAPLFVPGECVQIYDDCLPELADECLCGGCPGECNNLADCACPECVGNKELCPLTNCTDDGACDPYLEGCSCADCAMHPNCPIK